MRHTNIFKEQIVLFLVMFILGITLNPMNILAYRFSDLFLSLTLIYGGLLMASNMIWAHQIVHYINYNHFNKHVFFIGILCSLFFAFVLRNQLFVNNYNWLKRMIGHHSTAITTTEKLLKDRSNFENKESLFRLAKAIVYNQRLEIALMKQML
jgi:hypothetical protein